MAKLRQEQIIPRGEFFALKPFTSFTSSISYKGYYDPEPEETERIKARRLTYYRSFEPDWAPGSVIQNDLFHKRFPLPPPMRPDLVNKNVGFKRPHPKRPLLSFLTFPFYDFASYEVDQYTVISPEWKSAIESVEPGVHEFFPLNVVFKDAIISRFIFRERQNIIFFPEGQIVDPYDVLSPNRVKVRRSVLEGRHWVRNGSRDGIFVSRAMAEALAPLLSSETRLEPIRLVD